GDLRVGGRRKPGGLARRFRVGGKEPGNDDALPERQCAPLARCFQQRAGCTGPARELRRALQSVI
ncbi:MAG: hypothetical protein AVDCRST_MAG68-761, partial [uncultured Gemmatimonadetes bacterium]